MDWKLLATTFGTLFVAELGDKTQLACIMLAADTRKTWTVFLGSSLALVLVSLLGVLFASFICNYISPAIIRKVASVGFVAMGVLIFFDKLQPTGTIMENNRKPFRPEPFRLERWFARYEFSVAHHICASDCQSMTVADLLALEPGAEAGLADLWLGYTESAGDPALRQSIAGLYESVTPDQVLVFVGAEEAIFLFALAALEPGRRVLVMEPCYQSLADVARAQGCAVEPWPLVFENGKWTPDMELLRRAAPGLTAVMVNSPHNPTGMVMDAAHTAELDALSREHGFRVFSDEVYRFLEEPADLVPAACDRDPRHVSLGVMSKTFGLPGLRIGWVACRDLDLLGAVAALKDYTTICSPAPSEYLARVALDHWRALAGRSRQTIAANTALAEAFFARHAETLEWLPPTAGPIAFPRLRNADDAEPWCRTLAEEHGVLLLPGGVYGPAWKSHFRIGLGRDDFAAGLERLDAALAR